MILWRDIKSSPYSSPCPWFFALHREIITVIERTTHTALTRDASQTLPVSWKQRKGQWMHRNASKCLHMSAPWKVLWIPAEKALSEGYLGILHHLRSQVYQQKAPRCSTQPTVDGSEFSTGPCIYKLTLSWLIIYNYFMTSTAWTLPVLTYSVPGEVPPAVQRRVVPARLPWSKSPHRKLSASAWASNKVGCSDRKNLAFQ